MTLARAIARAASTTLKLPDRVPQSSGSLNALGSGGGLLGSGAQSGMEAYRSIGAAYGPIRRICESVALVKWSVYQQTGSLGDTDRQLLDDAEHIRRNRVREVQPKIALPQRFDRCVHGCVHGQISEQTFCQ